MTDIIPALRALGLWPERRSTAKVPRRPRKARAHVTRYELRDPEGILVAVHVREDTADGKRFYWQRPDGALGLGGTPVSTLPLYGVQLLRDRPSEPVILCEGQKATQTVLDAGRLAVGTVTGASGTPSDDALRPLAGRDVMPWADADEPGRGHIDRICEGLIRIDAHSVRCIRWLDAPEGGDAADFIVQHGAGEALDQLLAAAVPFRDGQTTDRAGVVLIRASSVRPERVRWAWSGRIPFGAVSLVVGQPGFGKSTVLMESCARWTRGQLAGDVEHVMLSVVIASAEDHRATTLVPRLTAAGADLERISFPEFCTVEGLSRGIVLPDDLAALESQLRAVGARILVLDPLVAYLSGRVNSWNDQHVRRALAPLAKMAEALDLALRASCT